MLAVVAGELSPIMTGLMYCSVIDTCRQVYALGRAREWTSAFSRVCEQQPEMVAFTGTCLVHRAEILQLQGAWPDAMTEACRACERAQRAERKPPGAAFYQQAEIHRLRGEFAKAEDAYHSASERGCEPQPGLALLRLAQGRTDAACAAIRRLTSATSDRLRRARLLPAYLEIMLAIGDIDEARRVRDELRELAHAFDTDVLRAVVAQADGAIALAEGDARAALDPLRCAFELWERHEAPYEAARVRVLIGHACRALGDNEAAGLEHQAAQVGFRTARGTAGPGSSRRAEFAGSTRFRRSLDSSRTPGPAPDLNRPNQQRDRRAVVPQRAHDRSARQQHSREARRTVPRGRHGVCLRSQAVLTPSGNLNAITREVDDARVWAGLHWRHSMRDGHQVGRRIAKKCDRQLLSPEDQEMSWLARMVPTGWLSWR